jgi:hypothetical protein
VSSGFCEIIIAAIFFYFSLIADLQINKLADSRLNKKFAI